MKSVNTLDKERRDFLKEQLKEYEQSVCDMTLDERKELRKWVRKGRSVYDNPWYISTGNGYPMDFVEASRAFDDISRNPDYYEEIADHEDYEYPNTDDMTF